MLSSLSRFFGAWEELRDTIGVSCDLSKAFDCVHQDTLIRKLRHYVRSLLLGILESYLSVRIERDDINGERSSGSAVNMGVPQGSVLEPLLVHINDLSHLEKDEHGIKLFADTSMLFNVNGQQPDIDDIKIILFVSAVLDLRPQKCELNGNSPTISRYGVPHSSAASHAEAISLAYNTRKVGSRDRPLDCHNAPHLPLDPLPPPRKAPDLTRGRYRHRCEPLI
ncbi:hypothetical protein EVAR_81569_1 [Eumeta japonica]|uniref:Reverse transcriptase domain-containing protein n=1 Tax=Eumeta variegata TaxID=151549 RepID=A0A4C1UZ76_EUMVA|nr:hypothetical protein EVAR_81569_1 [Eumeta japonica]